MSERLLLIKDLRAKGASIRMIDDVAAHLDANGGYDSPVFVATVEFIIKIRQMLQSVLQQYALNQAPKAEFTDKDLEETKDVNFPAAKAGVSGDDELEEEERAKILDHIEAVQAQRESFVEQLGAPDNKSIKKKKVQARRGNNLLERLFKINAAQTANKNNKDQAQRAQNEMGHDTARQAGARQAQQQNVSQATQRSSITKMNLVKMKLLSSLRMGKDRTVIGDAAWQAKKADKQVSSKEGKNALRDELNVLKANSSKAQSQDNNKSSESRDKKTTQEVSLSKIIDQAVKSKQTNKAVEQKPHEKGKFEKQHGEKTGPRANDENVAQMAAKDAINKLKESGVKTAAPDAKLKKEMDVQIAQVQAASGGGATPKLQR